MKHSLFANQRRATTAALLITPLVPLVISGVLTLTAGLWDPMTVAGFALIFYLIVLAVEVSLGLPLFLLLARHRLANWWSALVIGVIIGVAWAALIRLPGAVQLRDIIVLGTQGGAAAITFWAIHRLGPEPTETAVGRGRFL